MAPTTQNDIQIFAGNPAWGPRGIPTITRTLPNLACPDKPTKIPRLPRKMGSLLYVFTVLLKQK